MSRARPQNQKRARLLPMHALLVGVSLVAISWVCQAHAQEAGMRGAVDDGGEILSELDGCHDVDISATPFTNTLAIRRLKLKPAQAAQLRVVYLDGPSLKLRPVQQRYTCAEQRPDGMVMTYEGAFRGFKADLPLDADGLVIDYPETFRRV